MNPKNEYAINPGWGLLITDAGLSTTNVLRRAGLPRDLFTSGQKTITIGDGCATLIGEGMSDDEATIQMSRTDDCGYRGTVGGSQDGIPMTIHFTFHVQDSENITGDLHSTVSQSGTTCNMSRTYELTYSGP